MAAIEKELDWLRNRGHRLHKLVRSARSEYGAKLSMISQLRKDFEQLTWLLTADPEPDESLQQKNDREASSPRQLRAAAAEVAGISDDDAAESLDVERIVLYIDDLDRCPPKEVVEVLQAINLLLTFRIFVVVIGVDGRWLEASLRARHPDLLENPRDYLEKIIQIPFVLRPLTTTTYSALVDSLGASKDLDTRPRDGRERDRAGERRVASSEVHRSETQHDVLAGAQQGVELSTAAAAPWHAPHPEGVAISPPRPKSLVITDAELEWIARIGSILATPRTTKRLVNTYRMLRVCAGDEHAELFSPEGGREYRAVVLLLAVLIGYPAESARVFDALMAADAAAPAEPTLRAHLSGRDADKVCRLEHADDQFTVATYVRWLPLVRRFSYNLGVHPAA